jgi:hypothetical protein
MAISLTDAEKANIQHALDLMLKGQARETPFDSTIIENVGKAAASAGFCSTGAFSQRMLDNPFSTLLQLLLYVGA